MIWEQLKKLGRKTLLETAFVSKEWNKIVPKLNINNSLSLSSFKKTAKDEIFKYA